MTPLSSESLKENVLNVCRRIAGSHRIIAACFFGPRVCGYADETSDVHILLLLSGYRTGLRCHLKPLDGVNAFVLTVDQRIFERDSEHGWLGEFVAEKVTAPYEPLINEEYLRRQEVKVKERIVWELCENIVFGSPELCRELLIKPEYFMYEFMMRRARLFPPLTYSFLNMLRRDLRRKNVQSMMNGYLEALNNLTEEKQITFSNGYFKITQKLIDTYRNQKPRLPVFLRSLQRTMFLHVLNVISKMMTPLLQDQEMFAKSNRKIEAEQLIFQLEEPEGFLLMPTPLGPVPLSDETTIEDFVRQTVPSGTTLDIRIEQMGGVLNRVYLIKYRKNHDEQKVVVKRFKDWLGFKWFPLSLWTLGTKAFAVFGRARLEREYAMNQFLHTQGFPVPKVLHISHRERLLFEDFVEGENLVKTIKRIVSSREKVSSEVTVIGEVGGKIAEAHKLGIAFGDCKPENIIIAEDGRTYFVDLEQATRGGNQAWDVAEFLYYSGHYVFPIFPSDSAELIARRFIEGYLEAGGKKETIRRAASARYIKVFSIFTSLRVLLSVSDICRKMGER
ncbi:MAG: hypothetical protein JSV85_03250 [Candidatus Bathyarchaeota archaeon]|nr:MAG: hypothetical protein JSV85_03250 [Candidatus Bathyarchaeota archaeon]